MKRLVPAGCTPTIITDGGFHNAWFREVAGLDWNYVGRIRAKSGKKVSYDEGRTWKNCKGICKKATSTPRYVGEVILCKSNPMKTQLYSYKGKKKGRTSLNTWKKKRCDSDSLEHAKANREPWLLATSHKGSAFLMAKRVIKKYQKRMQIEEGFRDLKSTRYGFSFENAYSKKRERIAILLLIAMLASFVAWLVGWVVEKQGLHYQFQANSIKQRRVLSLFYLGCRAIKKKIDIPIQTLELALLTSRFSAGFLYLAN